MSSVPPSIAEAYDPERFRSDGHRLVDAVADALARWHRRDGVVLPWRAPDDALRAVLRQPLGGVDIVDQLRRVMAGSTALAHPHCMGHQVSAPLPSAVLSELVASVLNNGTSVYEYGPVSAPAEMAVIEWMADKLGMGPDAGGVMTSGGSLGNLTALLAMRQAKAGYDAWKAGARAPTRQAPSSYMSFLTAHRTPDRRDLECERTLCAVCPHVLRCVKDRSAPCPG